MSRQISTTKYLLAFILTLLVFSGGIMLGFLIENARLTDAKQITLTEKVNLRSLQLQQNFIESGEASCETLNSVLETNINELARRMDIVTSYEKAAVFNQEEFNLQLQDYFLTEIQFFLLSEEVDRQCEQTHVKVLYFYDENSQDTQGAILDYLKKRFGSKLLVFSFNSNFSQEPMIQILLSTYKIDTFPSVIVGEQVFLGHNSVETLFDAICSEFSNQDQHNELCAAKTP